MSRNRRRAHPRGNFALTSETVSDNELRQGNFANARTLLESAIQAANDDKPCFATSTSSSPEIRTFISQTPERLSSKLEALKAGAITVGPSATTT